jgi:uncharacterized protein YoaH (UPF0181 family)
MTDEVDEEIRQKIYLRFQRIFESPALVIMIPVQAMGAPPREWIPKAIDDIEELIDSGLSVNESCRRVAEEIAATNNIEPKTVEMTYRRHQREYWHEEFCRCVITKDLEGAVTAFRRLTLKSKKKYDLD